MESKQASSFLSSLRQAAAQAAERVRNQEVLEGIASAATLSEFTQKRLGERRLIIASNREPYVHQKGEAGVTWFRAAGGLTTALDSMAAACGAVWVCHGGGDADFDVTDAEGRVRVPPGRPSYTLKRLVLSPQEEQGYYEGFSNETLWPLCHVAHVRPKFNHQDWLTYRAVNLRFAQAIAAEAPPGAVVFLQDYHLALVGEALKAERPDLTTALFWHIPWPNPEIFRICPWKRELLAGLLGNDLLGFHLPYHAGNFLETADLELECHFERELQAVSRRGHRCRVRAYPISVDFESIFRQANTPRSTEMGTARLRTLGLEGVKVGLGVDRLDYTKGIPERLAALERLFETRPQWLGRFTFVQIGVPSRTNLEDYRNVVAEIEATCDRLTERFGRPGWKPVLLLKGHQDFDTLIPFYKLADLCVVSSLHDGMNLVAKEFVAASSSDRGVLVLSPFTGSARSLDQALLVNPYDTESFADILDQALSMPLEEQRERLRRMRAEVAEHNIYRWAQDILADAMRVAEEPAAPAPS